MASKKLGYSHAILGPTLKEIRPVTKTEINSLLERAKHITMSEGEREQQRRSFAYGNANIENEAVTRTVIDNVADRMIQEPEVDDLTSGS